MQVVEETGWRDHQSDIRLLCVHQTFGGATVGPAGYTFRRGHDVIRTADIPGDFVAVLLLQMYPGNEHRIQQKFQSITYGIIEDLH